MKLKFLIILKLVLLTMINMQGIFLENPGIIELREILEVKRVPNISTLCEEGDFNLCYEECIQGVNVLKFIDKNQIDSVKDNSFKQVMIEYNNLVSDYWFYAGQIEYWGLIKKKPNLTEGFSKFIISSYFGNPKAQFKIYVMLESDIYKLIVETKDYENTKSANPLLQFIMNSKYSENFKFSDDYEKHSVAAQFLYSSALFKYPSAMMTLAYKYYKGYGVPFSCDSALNYYKEIGLNNVKKITNRHKPNYYEKINLESLEYIGHKFSNDNLDVGHLIDYLKVEAMNGQINYIQQLGQRYLYGQGIAQNFQEAFFYFDMGYKLGDSECTYYLGELYLNGWGVNKNYQEAFRLFSIAMQNNFSKAWNSLGYMYYYGLGIEKNIRRAYDYFKIAFNKGEDSDAYFNMATLLIEGNGVIDVDFSNAYKYGNYISSKGHTFGTYLFAMLNEHQLGSIINNCEITIEFFRQVAERDLLSKYKFDLAIKYYKEGFHKVASLIYIELAEEGYEYGQINSGLIFKNYDIFVNSAFNKYLSYKYFTMAYKARNVFSTLMLADFYYYGYGDLQIDYHKARDLYKKVVKMAGEHSFYSAHAYFNLGLMHHFGNGIEQNYTNALKAYNISSQNEPNAFYPEFIMKKHITFSTLNLSEMIILRISSFFNEIFQPGLPFYIITFLVISYLIFLYSLKTQKD